MYLLLSWPGKGKNNIMVKTNSAPLYACLYTSYEASAEVSEQLELSCWDTPVALSQDFQIGFWDDEQYSADTFLMIIILQSVDPGSAAQELCVLPTRGMQPLCRGAQQPGLTTSQTCCSPPWAGARSHSRVTEGWRAWFGIKSNFKHLKCSV